MNWPLITFLCAAQYQRINNSHLYTREKWTLLSFRSRPVLGRTASLHLDSNATLTRIDRSRVRVRYKSANERSSDFCERIVKRFILMMLSAFCTSMQRKRMKNVRWVITRGATKYLKYLIYTFFFSLRFNRGEKRRCNL